MVMKSFVSEITEVNMLLDTSKVIKNPKWNGYMLQVIGIGDDTAYHVLNWKGKKVNVEWATYEGAAACAELLAEGYLKE